MPAFEITQNIIQLEQELKDINNRIRNEPAPIHYQMLAEVQAKLNSLRFQLEQIDEQTNPIQTEILKLQTQILAIPSGFKNTSSASRREADNNINLKNELQSKIESLKIQLQAPNKVIPNNQIPGPMPIPQPTQTGAAKSIPILPIAAGVGVLLLIVAVAKRKKK